MQINTPRGWQGALPAAACLFVGGRVRFARGYAHGAPHRAVGFALTFYPTQALMIMVAAARMLLLSLSGGH